MKLLPALGLGAIASVALPYAFRAGNGMFSDFIRQISQPMQLGDIGFRFSLTIFLVVALFSWAFLVWSDK